MIRLMGTTHLFSFIVILQCLRVAADPAPSRRLLVDKTGDTEDRFAWGDQQQTIELTLRIPPIAMMISNDTSCVSATENRFWRVELDLY